jgi:hypothetical protein
MVAVLGALSCAAPSVDQRPNASITDAVFCDGRPEECTAYDSTRVPSNQRRRTVSDRDQEVRSLGFTLRWDPGTSGGESRIEAGNSPTYNGDPRSDP